MRTALITGVTGQDGVYLARHLLSTDYRVVGTVRPGSVSAHATHYLAGANVRELDQRDGSGFEALLEATRPDEIYNLAGFTSVGASWAHAEQAADTNGMSVLRTLEALLRYRDRHGTAPRLFQPSSSEVFGAASPSPHTEDSPQLPRNPYAVSKSFAHHVSASYRDAHDLFTTSGILYNHESPLRGPSFVTRKISRSVAEIAFGRRESITLGNLDVRRDWGFAGDYVRAMRQMMSLDAPSDFIIATGESHPLSYLLEVAFSAAGLGDPSPYVERDPALMRPADVADLFGDPTKAREQLGWAPTVSFEQVIQHMVQTDMRRMESGVEEHVDYLQPTDQL